MYINHFKHDLNKNYIFKKASQRRLHCKDFVFFNRKMSHPDFFINYIKECYD